jgi:hypothetical protein
MFLDPVIPANVVQGPSKKICAEDALLAFLGGDAEEVWHAIELFLWYSFQPQGCKIAQKALERASPSEKALLAKGLTGNICSALVSKYANYVVQKLVDPELQFGHKQKSNTREKREKREPPAHVSSILDELTGHVCILACHPFAYRTFLRILECLHFDEKLKQLFDEVIQDAKSLSTDQSGTYVIRHLLEYGTAECRHEIANDLIKDIVNLAKHQLGSYVVEDALKHCSVEDRFGIAALLVKNANSVEGSQYGQYVLNAAREATREIKLELEERHANELEELEAKKKAHIEAFNVYHHPWKNSVKNTFLQLETDEIEDVDHGIPRSLSCPALV